MTKALDLNALERPTLDLTLRDKDHTKVRITLPETKLIERLFAATPELKKVSKTKDADSIKAIYELMADLISNNLDCLTFTAEALRDQYKVSFEDLIVIASAYVDFVSEIQNAKN